MAEGANKNNVLAITRIECKPTIQIAMLAACKQSFSTQHNIF